MVHEHPGAFTKDFQDFMVDKRVFVHCSPLDFTASEVLLMVSAMSSLAKQIV